MVTSPYLTDVYIDIKYIYELLSDEPGPYWHKGK
jgi:hypothetical protein